MPTADNLQGRRAGSDGVGSGDRGGRRGYYGLFKMNSRQEGYKYHPRPHKLDREEPSPHHYALSRSGASTPTLWKPYLPQDTPSRMTAHYEPSEDEGRASGILRERREE
jgi:hypothetical protein